MSGPEQQNEPPAIPQIPSFPADDAGSSSTVRRPRPTKRTPVVALGLAILLGGGLAWGVVALIPDSWKLRWKGGDDSKPAAEERDPGFDSSQPAVELPGGTDPVIPARTRRQHPAGGGTPDDDDARVARQLERSASQMLSEARTLLSKKKNAEAVRVLEDLRNRYPGTKAAGEAERLLLTID